MFLVLLQADGRILRRHQKLIIFAFLAFVGVNSLALVFLSSRRSCFVRAMRTFIARIDIDS